MTINPYYTALFIFTVLAATHPATVRWLRSRWADVRDAMREENEE